MRDPSVRRVLRVVITLLGLEPLVWREVIVARDLSLAEVHAAIALSLGWPLDAHHVFTDRPPDHDGGHSPSADSRRATARRWGDRWTMIDWRDPAVADERGAALGPLLDAGPLFHGCDVAGRWWCRVEARGDDLVSADAPAARLTTGSGRAPIPGGPGPDELPRLHAIVVDAAHPDHDDVVARLAAAVGPWSSYRPGSAELDAARHELARRFASAPSRRAPAATGAAPGTSSRSRLDALVEAAPVAARSGLRMHVLRHLPDPPSPVSPELVAETLRPLTWLMSVVGAEGAPLVDGFLAPHVAAAGTRALGWSEARLRDLVVRARELRLVRRFRGRLVLLAAAAPLRESPVALWHHVADAVWNRHGMSWGSEGETALLLLAVADGTLADPDAGDTLLAAGLAAFEHRALSDGRTLDDPCRDAGRSGGRRHARPEPPTRSARSRVDQVDAVDTLSILGLERRGDGGWTVPEGLRALARAALALPAEGIRL